MEAIPKEVIDMAEDFFLYLNDEEKKEVIAQYVKEQPNLWYYLEYMIDKNKMYKVAAHCEKIYLVIYRSYKYYGIPLSPLTPDYLSLKSHELLKVVSNNGKGIDTAAEVENLIKTIYKQKHLLDYIYEKVIHATKADAPYEDTDEMAKTYIILTTVAYILESEMKKYISDEIN